MLSVANKPIMLSVIMLNVVMLSVGVPFNNLHTQFVFHTKSTEQYPVPNVIIRF
jgi:hypothetical protein